MRNNVALLMACMPVLFIFIGTLVGLYRYKKYGNEIRTEEEQKYKDAQEKGGLNTLLWKKAYKRVTARTFGIPMLIGMAAGIIWVFILFQLF